MREQHHWNVTLQADTGEVIERPVAAYWDPTKDFVGDGIGPTAEAEAFMDHKKKVIFQVIAVANVD